MIYESKITFHKLEMVKFIRPQDVANFSIDKPYEFSISLQRHSILIMNEQDSPIGKLREQDFYIVHSKETGDQITLYQAHKKQHIAIATIQGSKSCVKAIYEKYIKNKQYKSCLAFVPSKVQHISILSGQSATQRYRGFINLAGIMFLVLNIRNILDNFYHYGLRFQTAPTQFIPIHTIIATGALSIFVFMAFILEKMKFSGFLSPTSAKILLTTNWMMVLIINLLYCHSFIPTPIPSIVFTALAVILVLKLISFQQVNSELYKIINKFKENKKKDRQSKIAKDVFSEYEISQQNLVLITKYEGNWERIVNFNKLVYFIVAPTLCYQLEYPKTLSIRKIWLIKRLIQFVFVMGLQLILWFQYMQPALKSLLNATEQQDTTWIELLNRHLRLAVPNTLGWIAGFYSLFHLWFNILAELLYFGDRNFYKDWWNCRNIEQYWKTWNIPVHFWFIRHVYNPLLKKGFKKITANLIVFFISAVAHEYLVSVPLGLLSYYAFLAMLMQAPTIFIQKKVDKLLRLENSELGNASFWIFFCFIGQPFVLTIYYSIYMKMHPEQLSPQVNLVP